MSEREIGNECLNEAKQILGLETDKEVQVAFGSWMKENFPEMWADAESNVDNLDGEDYGHFADAYVCAIGRSAGSSGGGSGTEWVGMVMGFERRFDMMEKKRNMAIDVATADLGLAIKNGFNYNGKKWGIGRVFAADGVWKIEHSSGTFISKEKAESNPNWLIHINEKIKVAVMKPDNTPGMIYGVKSVWAFHGNTKEKFLNEGPRTVILEGSWDAAKVDFDLWRPITLRGELDEEGYNGSGPTLTVGNPNVVYGIDWVEEGRKRDAAAALFNPEQYLTTTGDSCINLKDVIEYHEDNKKPAYVDKNGIQRWNGPLVCVVGGVMDVNHEGKDNQWDPTGRDYYISISNQLLRRENPNARVGVKIPGLVRDDHHGMEMKKNGEWVKFARGSRVWIVGRSNVYQTTDGETRCNIEAVGIYAVPKKSIPYQEPSNESNDLGNLGGFGVGGDL